MTASPILVHGHRGARARFPENTIPAFEYAISAGADALELDLAVTRDNVVVVSHDPVLCAPLWSGPCPTATIRELTVAESREWQCGTAPHPEFPQQTPVPGTGMPALDDVLGLSRRGAFGFDLEIKCFPGQPHLTPDPDEFAGLVLDCIRAHGLEERTVVQSFDFRTLHAMRKAAPEIRLAALYEEEPDWVSPAEHARIVSPHFRLVNGAKVARAQASGISVVAWTPNQPDEWDALIEAGVHGIITDDPAALLAHLHQKGLR